MGTGSGAIVTVDVPPACSPVNPLQSLFSSFCQPFFCLKGRLPRPGGSGFCSQPILGVIPLRLCERTGE
jgi:hypothetical protein